MKKFYLLLSLLFFIGIIINAQENHKVEVNKEGYYLNAFKMPELIGGMENLANKVVYPESEKTNRVQGQVLVEVYISDKGDVIKTAIQKGINPALDQSALDAVNSTKWKPAINDGKAVKSKILLPIRFKLDDKKPGNNQSELTHPPSGYLEKVDKEPEPIGGMGSIMSGIKYPEKEKKNGVQGKVLIKAYIDENGNVTQAVNIPQDNKNFIKAATDAIKKAKFTPAEKNGKKVKSVVTIPVQFKLQ